MNTGLRDLRQELPFMDPVVAIVIAAVLLLSLTEETSPHQQKGRRQEKEQEWVMDSPPFCEFALISPPLFISFIEMTL